jgi:hypothetical protein
MVDINKKMFIKTNKDEIFHNNTNSKAKRKFIVNRLFEFDRSQSKQIVKGDRSD